MKKNKGFTLFEILIALFIFTILAMLLSGALRTIIDAHTQTEVNATRLRDLQKALLVMSRDIEQAINRPIKNKIGEPEGAFIGTPEGFHLTHTGFANQTSSHLQRVEYVFHGGMISKTVWQALDQAPLSSSHTHVILKNTSDFHLEYLDQTGKFYAKWPIGSNNTEALPRAVRVQFLITHWGKVSQVYVIPT